jgi:NAD(P)-dependent dehydrogenase (short-subunit alcohol dehydrogenase family)
MEVENMVRKCVEEFGKVDYGVHCAGVTTHYILLQNRKAYLVRLDRPPDIVVDD